MRAATSVLTLISACVVTAVVTVAVMNNMDAVETTSPAITHTHEVSSSDFSAEAAQLVVSRA